MDLKRPDNYEWLKPGIAVTIYNSRGVKRGELVVHSVEVERGRLRVYYPDGDSFMLGLRDCDYYALPQDLSILNNSKRWI